MADIPREIEFKFLLPPGFRPPRTAMRAIGARGEPEPRQEETTYFDTARGALRRAGVSLRIRRQGGGRVQTVKAAGDGGAFARGEWETAVRHGEPAREDLAGTPAAKLLARKDALLPVFATEISRSRWRLEPAEGSAVEMCLDQGTIRAGEARLPVSEIELELKQGEMTALVAAALSLHHMLPQAVLSVDSKASRGWQLRTGEHGPAAKADDLDLPEEVPVAEAFGQVLGNCLSQLLANQAAVLAGDAEGVHQMRVSIRRMRAGLRLFRPLLRREALAEMEEELRQLGRVLGAARDWDVFADETLPAAKPELGGRNAGAMREAAEAERQAAHAAVVAALNAPGFTGLMLRLVEARIDPAPLLSPNCDAAPLEEEVPALLARLQRKARKRGRGIAKRSPEELHGLRKSLKKLRYGTEFLRSVLKAKRARRFLHGLKDLQTQLGAMNDAAVAAQLAETLRHRHGAMDIAATRLAHRVGREREEAHSALPKAWKRFRKAELPA